MGCKSRPRASSIRGPFGGNSCGQTFQVIPTGVVEHAPEPFPVCLSVPPHVASSHDMRWHPELQRSSLGFVVPASSTPAPCPRLLFATLVTSRRRVHDQRHREALSSPGLLVSRLHLGPLCTRSDSRSVQSSCSFASSSLAERIQLLLKIGLLLRAIRESNLHPVTSLTCLHIRGTRSLLEVRLSLECSWSGACSEVLSQSPDFLAGTCPEISQLLAQRSPLLTTCLLPGETGDSALGTKRRERCSSGPNGMTALPVALVLNQFAAQPYVDVVHSTSHGSSLIYEFTENTLHSSVHERLVEFPQTAPLLVSSAPLQLRGWIPPAPPASATCCPSARPRHPVGLSVESCRCGPSPREYQWHHLPVRPRALLARSSRAQDSQMREVSWSPTPETSDLRLGLHAGPGGTVCVLHPIHIVASRLVPCLSAVQALCSLTDQVLELPFCQHRGASLHLHQRCARQSCFEELKRILVVESHELSVLVSPHLSVVWTALSSSSAIDFCTVAILSSVLDNSSWNS